MTPTASGPGPFDPTGSQEPTHLLLADDHGERSLWPVYREVPAGWRTVFGPAPYEECAAEAVRGAADGGVPAR